MWTEEDIQNRWTKAKFECRLMRTGLASFRRSNQKRYELARVGWLRPGEVTLTLGRSILVLDRDDEELLRVPFRNISAVKVRSMSVDIQMFTALGQSLRSSAWFGVAKTALCILAALSMIDLSWGRLPSLVQRLPDVLAWSGVSVLTGLLLHLPFRFLPRAWRIEGRLWRMRFETMDGHCFSLLLDPGIRDQIVMHLRETGLVVYIDQERKTWLDRSWPLLKVCETFVRRWASDLF